MLVTELWSYMRTSSHSYSNAVEWVLLFPHFTDDKTEVQRGEAICPRFVSSRGKMLTQAFLTQTHHSITLNSTVTSRAERAPM